MSTEALARMEQIFASWGNYLDTYRFIGSILREAGWFIVTFLASICDAMEEVFDLSMKVMTFSSSSLLGEWISNTFGSIAIPLCTIAFIVIGMYFIFSDKKPAVIRNIIVSLAVIILLPTLMSFGNELIQAVKTDVLDSTNGTLADTTIKSNVVDMAYIADPEINFGEVDHINNISPEYIRKIEINEVITKDSDGISEDAATLFTYKRTIDSAGKISYEEIEGKGWLDIFDPPYYYRYGINFFTIDLILLGNIILILLASFKALQLLVEIVVSRIIATVGSAEIASGAKTRKALEGILHAYLTICCTMICIRLYSMISEFMTASLGKINLAGGFFLFILAFILADGPAVCEKIFGYDAGISNMGRKLMMLGHGASAAKRGIVGNDQHTGLLGTKGVRGSEGIFGKVGSAASKNLNRNSDSFNAAMGAASGNVQQPKSNAQNASADNTSPGTSGTAASPTNENKNHAAANTQSNKRSVAEPTQNTEGRQGSRFTQPTNINPMSQADNMNPPVSRSSINEAGSRQSPEQNSKAAGAGTEDFSPNPDTVSTSNTMTMEQPDTARDTSDFGNAPSRSSYEDLPSGSKRSPDPNSHKKESQNAAEFSGDRRRSNPIPSRFSTRPIGKQKDRGEDKR